MFRITERLLSISAAVLFCSRHGGRLPLDLLKVPDDATPVIAHALKTFGSVRRTIGWLNDRCGALNGEVPLRLILAGQKDRVDAELDLIEEGAYV
jgi:Protein of unknown function (DUF2384)